MTAKRSFWTADLADGSKLGITVAWEGWNGAPVHISLAFGADDVERRSGKLSIETSYTPGEGGLYGLSGRSRIKSATVSSLNGDVIGHARSIKAAAEDYASKVAKAVVESRRRAALVDGARKLSNGEIASVELTHDEVTALLVLVDDRRAKGHLTDRSREFFEALDAKLAMANAEMVRKREAATV